MIIDGFLHQLPDLDPEETQEWLNALDQVIDVDGKARAHFLMAKLIELDRKAAERHPSSLRELISDREG